MPDESSTPPPYDPKRRVGTGLAGETTRGEDSAVLPDAHQRPLDVIGDFEITGRLGQGGMGTVYRARQISLDREVALKILPQHFEADPDYVSRFQREARVAASLSHANLVKVYASGEADGSHYIAMELIEGETLAHWVKRGALPPLDALRISLDVAQALECGWRTAQLIHRDIKPGNIFLSVHGEVKLGDLGLAKIVGGESSTGLTQAGKAVGTPHYISPEQARGDHDLDFRTDIYSLGCTLYQMLTGQTPYSGGDPMVVMNQHINAPPPAILKVMPQCPLPLGRLVSKMIKKQKRERYASYEELIAAIEGVRVQLDPALGAPSVPESLEAASAYSTPPGGQGGTTGLSHPHQATPVDAEGRRGAPPPAWKKPRFLLYGGIAAGVAALGTVAFLLWPKPEKLTRAQLYAREHPSEPQAAEESSSPAVASGESAASLTTAKDASVASAIPPAATPEPRTPTLVAQASVPSTPVPATPAPATPPPSTPQPSTPVAAVPIPSATPKPATEVEKWFAQVDGPQQATFQKQVLKPFEAGVAELRARYLASVDAALAKASTAGQLGEALAWRTERQTFEKAQNVAADDDNTPANLKVLRGAFRQQLARLDEDRMTKAKAMLARYDTVLAKNQTLLTQHQRLDDALLIKTKRDEIALAWLAPSPLISAGPADHPESATPNPKPATPMTNPTTAQLPATREKPFENALGMKFVPVPIVGGPTAGKQVLFSIWDTRAQDYEVFADETKGEMPKLEGAEQEPTHPVVMVSWEDAQAFCQWLTEREQAAGRLPVGWRYRLPSDHEWSCAVELGGRENAAALPADKTKKIAGVFPWGTQWPPPAGAGNYAGEEMKPVVGVGKYNFIKGFISGYRDDFIGIAPVGSFTANRFGLFDMSGNVLQWCEDWFSQEQKDRVNRGSAWHYSDRNNMLSSARSYTAPDRRTSTIGFRCVVAPVTTAPPTSASVPGASRSPTTAATATTDQPFVNTLGMKFVPVPIIGGPTARKRVLFSIWDTRAQDYEVFANEAKREMPRLDGVEQEPTHPVVVVSWEDAQAFCKWLTDREQAAGHLPAEWRYRLPSDHEWSCAVELGGRENASLQPADKSGKTSGAYPWGTQWPPPAGAGNYAGEELQPVLAAGKYNVIKGFISGYRDDFVELAPVGSFPANRFGLFDMGGNVTQWCEDWIDKQQKERVLRGSAWHASDRYTMLSSYRGRRPASYINSTFGFRCVLAPPAR